MNKNLSVNYIFWIGYILIIMGEMLNNIVPLTQYIDFITYTGLGILLVYIFISNQSYTKNFFALYTLIILFSIITFLLLNDFTILKLIIMLISLKKINFEDFIKNELKIRTLLFILVFICSIVGLCGTTIFIRGNVTRHTLGFIHPNTTGFYLLLIGLEYIYVKRKSIQKKDIFLLLILSLVIYYVTNSRTACYVLIITIIAIIYVNYSKRKILDNKLIKFCCTHMFLIITIFTFVISYLYSNNNKIAILINELFSYRLKYFSYFVSTYPIALFGSNLSTYFVLDSTYLQLILRFGLIAYLFYYIMYVKSFKLAYKEKNYFLIIIMLAMLLYGFTENAAYKSTYNVFLLVFSDIIFNKKRDVQVNE